jgi:hypothetical protein
MNGESESANPATAGRPSNPESVRGPAGAHEVTRLLADWSRGDEAALQTLTPLVYKELRRLAHRYMEGQSPDRTLQTTALVHEAYLRLVDQDAPTFTNRSHFFCHRREGDAPDTGRSRQVATASKTRRGCRQSRTGRNSDDFAGTVRRDSGPQRRIGATGESRLKSGTRRRASLFRRTQSGRNR